MMDRGNFYTFIPPTSSPGLITEDEEGDDPTSEFTYALYPVCDDFHDFPELYKIVAEMREKAYKEIEARVGCDYVWMMDEIDRYNRDYWFATAFGKRAQLEKQNRLHEYRMDERTERYWKQNDEHFQGKKRPLDMYEYKKQQHFRDCWAAKASSIQMDKFVYFPFMENVVRIEDD
jgi:hypothetical protein